MNCDKERTVPTMRTRISLCVALLASLVTALGAADGTLWP